MNHGTSSRGVSKQRATNDDGFEARSQFNVYYPPTQYPIPPFVGTTAYGSFPIPSIGAGGQIGVMPFVGGQQQYLPNLSQAMPPNGMPQFPPQQQQFYPGGGRGQGFDQMSQMTYPQPVQLSRSPQSLQQPSTLPQQQMAVVNQSITNTFLPNNRQPALQNGKQWTHTPQPPYQNQFQSQGFPQPPQSPPMDRRNYSSPGNMPSQTQYPFGQLPNKPFVPGSSYMRQQQQQQQQQQHQHPVPGSYNRQPFNPKTQAFIPGSSFPMSQTNSNGTQPYPPAVPGQFGNSPNIPSGFPRQGPSPIPTNYGPQSLPTCNLNPNGAYSGAIGSQGLGPQGPPPVQSSNVNHIPRQTQGSISKWGSPSLPKKPPPPTLT
jgi:hypothetical protein